MKKLPIITIDGPSGVGKTTIAALLAQEMGLPYLDTGAMFRYLALQGGPESPRYSDSELEKLGKSLQFSLAGTGAYTTLLCNGKPVGEEIRTEKAGALASALATRPVVRELLLSAQREIGNCTALVTEGRDMGTVVFPQAACKFFLDANAATRAMRRCRQYAEKGNHVDLAQLEKEIRERDSRDRNRPVAPLKPASDAVIIDTSNLDIEAILGQMLADIRKLAPHLFPAIAHP